MNKDDDKLFTVHPRKGELKGDLRISKEQAFNGTIQGIIDLPDEKIIDAMEKYCIVSKSFIASSRISPRTARITLMAMLEETLNGGQGDYVPAIERLDTEEGIKDIMIGVGRKEDLKRPNE